MRKIFVIEPNVESFEDFACCAKVLKQIGEVTVFTLCSEVQRIVFENQGYATLNLGDTIFPLEEREIILKRLGDSEGKAYLSTLQASQSFPFNPFVISGGPTNLRTFHVFLIIRFFDYCIENKIKVIYFSGSVMFRNILRYMVKHSSEKIQLKEIKIKKIKSNNQTLVNTKYLLKNILNFTQSLFSKKPLLIYNASKNIRYFLSIEKYLFFHISPHLKKNSYLVFLNLKKHKLLDENARISYENVLNVLSDPIFERALRINHDLIVAKSYHGILDTIRLFKLISWLKKNIIYLSEINHGASNLFFNLLAHKQTIFVQHAVIPGSYRSSILSHVEAKKVVLYSKFKTGSLSIEAPNCKETDYISYVNQPKDSNSSIIKKDILFAPTTEGYFLSDYEYKMLIEVCQVISSYCERLNININVKLHQKTPYCDYIYNELGALPKVKIIQNVELSQAINDCGMLISSVNSNVIIEGFMGQKPVVIFNDLSRHNYINEYESGFCEAFSVKEIVDRINNFLEFPDEIEKLLAVQNQFIEKYIQS